MDSYKFDVNKEIENIKEFIKGFFKDTGGKKAIIGMSGGKDSTIVAKLMADAIGANNIIGVMMPNGIQTDIQDAYEAAECVGIRIIEVNVGDAYHYIKTTIDGEMEQLLDIDGASKVSSDADINLSPRLRMSVLYNVAQHFDGGMVVNTCNLSEDYIGYSTKYGDSAGDLSPCGHYTVTEMLKIGDALGLPSHLVHKKPADGLSGVTDEDKIGFSYKTLDKLIRTGKCDDANIRENIMTRHYRNLHKLRTIPTCMNNLHTYG